MRSESFGTKPLVVTYAEKKPKPTGLDWAAISGKPTESPAQPPPPVKKTKGAHCQTCGRPTPVKGICTRCKELEDARREREFAPPPQEPTTMATTTPKPAPAPDLVDEEISLEIRSVVETLTETARSQDVVVNACRAAVIAAADALRGAMLRAGDPTPGEPGRRVGQKTTPGRHHSAPTRIEDERPTLVDDIRRLYDVDGRGIESIAAMLKISPNTVSRVMHRNGIELRPASESNSHAAQRVRDRLAALNTTSIDVRSWAVKNNIAVSDRGTIPESVLDAFEARR